MNTEICQQLVILRLVTSAYHPQTNGLDKRTNQTLKLRLAKLVNEQQDNWDDYIEENSFLTQKQASTNLIEMFGSFSINEWP